MTTTEQILFLRCRNYNIIPTPKPSLMGVEIIRI